ncbi:MAG: hypothetical protein Q8Q01_03710, partial [archaeon]|nr:hypothetical protein [archaeon]
GTLRNETTSSTNDTLFNMTLSASSLLDGNHTLFVYANDTAGNENDTFDTDVNVSFLVDTTNPETVELYNLTGGKIITDTIPTFEWQVNDTWTTTLICDLIVDDSINTAGISSTNGTTTDYTLLAAISSGNHNWSISCNDSVNLNSNSMTHNFTISTGAPSINAINSPITRTNFTTGDIIVFNASVSDDIAVTSVLFQISNGSNLGNLTGSSTNASLFNASLTVSSESIVDGNHTLTVFASDGSNLSSDATVNFLVDTTTPDTVELYNLTNNRSILDTTPTFEWQVNDTWATTLTCDLIVDDSINTADISSINGTTTDYTIPIAIALGDHNWSVSCNDSVLLNNLSITQNFTINQSDITPPILIGSATLITSSTAQLVVTTNEEATCKYDSGEMSYAEMRYIMDGSGTLSHSHSVTGLSSSRAYVYYVRCQDALGNSNPSSTQIAFTTSAGAGAGSGGSGGGSAVVEESTSEDSIIDGSLLKTATAGDVITLLGAGKVTVDVMTAAEITYEASSSESISTAEKITFTITNNGDTIVNLYPELKEELISPEYIDEFEDNLRKWSSELGEPLTEEQIDLYKLIEQKNVQPIFTEKTFSLDNLFKPGEVPVENVGEQVISTTPIVTFTEVPIYYLNDGDQTITLTPELKGEEIVLENQAEMESALNLRISEEHPELSRDEQEKLLQEIINSIKITGDVQPILTEKTFGFFESNEDIVHTGQQITGKLLESSLEDCGEVVLKPGEIFEKTCTVRRRITANPTSTQIVFKSENKKVLEKDVDPQEGAIGAAVDVDLQKNLIELYMLIPKVGGSDKFNDYSLEFMIDDKLVDTINGDTNLKYLFAELFGPFLVREDKGFVFAQQFKYKPEVYYGNKLIQTRVIKNGEVVAQHEFNVYFGEQEGQMKLAIFEDGMSSIIFGFVLFTIVVVLLGLITIAGNYGEDLNGKRRTKSRFFKFVFFIAVILLSGSLLLGLDNEHQIKNTVPGLNQNEISQVTSDNTQLTGNTGLISQTENLKEDSWLSSGITYTGQHVKGKLLESYLEDCGELFVKPGEKVEKTCTLRKGLSANPVPRKIVFKSAGEDVLEKDIAEQDSGMGVTIDLFKDEKLLELYMLIPAIDGLEKFNDYFLEFTVSNEENSNPIFAEVYGPYSVREDKGFIFAQQLKYNPEIYAGQKQIQMKLFKENKIIAQQEFAMDFGGEESVSNLRFWDRINTRLVLTALLMFIFIPAVMIMYFIKKRRKFEYF